MLVLSRYADQSIVIAEGIVVTILEINRGQVRIGIEASRDVNIIRSELLKRESDDSHREDCKEIKGFKK